MVVLVAIAIAAAAMVSLAALLAAEHRAVEADRWSEQAQWLAESGLARAVDRLRADTKYSGELWKIPSDVFPSREGGSVRIEIQPVPEQSLRRRVRVQADFPDQAVRRARHSRELVVTLRPARS
jgi:type II secretory pathway component PulK